MSAPLGPLDVFTKSTARPLTAEARKLLLTRQHDLTSDCLHSRAFCLRTEGPAAPVDVNEQAQIGGSLSDQLTRCSKITPAIRANFPPLAPSASGAHNRLRMTCDRAPTAKQARFIAEYLLDLNAAGAATRAGYGARSARHTASRLLQKPHVRAEVQRLQAKQLEKAEVTAEGVLEQLRRVAFFDPRDVYDDRGSLKHPTEWPAPARAALVSFDVTTGDVGVGDASLERIIKVRLESKLQALELLAKHLGLLTDRRQVDQTLTITWLPSEPPPPLPVVETIDAMGPPQAANDRSEPAEARGEEMGFAPTAPGPIDRTHIPRFSDSQEEPSSAVPADAASELARSREVTGMSERALTRMFPELRRR